MADEQAKLIVRMEAETGRLQKELDRTQKKIKRFEQQTKKDLSQVGRHFRTFLSVAAFASLGRQIAQSTREQEKAVAQLEAGLASTGGIVGRSLEQLTAQAAELQKVTTFGDEQIIQAQAQLITFTGITEDAFDRTISAALDLSTRMDQDLKSSVLQLGKALNDPIANLGALGRAGIQFSDAQKTLIKSLAETGRLAEAQTIILEELETQFGGSARAARDTFGGALEGLGNAFGDLFESTEGLEKARQDVEDFTAVVQDPRTVEAVNSLTSAFIKLAAGAVNAGVELVNLGDQIAVNFANLTGNLLPEDKIRQQIKDVDRALKGGFSTPIKFLFTGEEELKAERDRLLAQYEAIKNGFEGDPITLGMELQDVERNLDAVKAALAGLGDSRLGDGLRNDMDQLLARKAELQGQIDLQVNLKVSGAVDELLKGDLFGFGGGTMPAAAAAPAVSPPVQGKKELEQIQSAFDSYVEKLQEANQLTSESTELEKLLFEVRSGGLQGIDAGQQARLETLATSVDVLNESRAAEEAYQQVLEEGRSLTESFATDQEQYAARVENIDMLLQAGAISQQTYNRAFNEYRQSLALATPEIDSLAELNDALSATLSNQERELAAVREQMAALNAAAGEFPGRADEIAAAMGRLELQESALIDSLQETSEELSVFAEQAARNIQDSFADFLFDPFDQGLEGMLKGFVNALKRMVAEAAAADLASALKLPGAGGGGNLNSTLGALFGAVGSAFGGGKAKGGPVKSGTTYLVGENGPELFTPAGSGEIVTNEVLQSLAMAGDTSATDNSGITNLFSSLQGGDTTLASTDISVIEERLQAMEQMPGMEALMNFGGFRADGGSVAAGSTYLVGENGPELYTPSALGNIVSNQDMRRIGGSGGTTIINVAPAENRQQGFDTASQIKSRLARDVRQSGRLIT